MISRNGRPAPRSIGQFDVTYSGVIFGVTGVVSGKQVSWFTIRLASTPRRFHRCAVHLPRPSPSGGCGRNRTLAFGSVIETLRGNSVKKAFNRRLVTRTLTYESGGSSSWQASTPSPPPSPRTSARSAGSITKCKLKTMTAHVPRAKRSGGRSRISHSTHRCFSTNFGTCASLAMGRPFATTGRPHLQRCCPANSMLRPFRKLPSHLRVESGAAISRGCDARANEGFEFRRIGRLPR